MSLRKSWSRRRQNLWYEKYISETYKIGDTFTLKELLGKEDIKYRAFTRALGVMRDNGEIDIVKPGVYKIKAFAVEYFWYTLRALFLESIFTIVDYVVIFV